MLLFETTNYTKSIKVIKDHHKGATLANMTFLDWDRDKQARKEERIKQLNGEPFEFKQSTEQSWMFASVDSFGRIMITSIMKKMFMWQAWK